MFFIDKITYNRKNVRQMKKSFCIMALLAASAGSFLRGERRSLEEPLNFSQATISEIVNNVEVVDTGTLRFWPARVKEIFRAPNLLKTGRKSRAQLLLTDGTVVRVGANAVFSFEAHTRTIRLKSGTVLFHSPTGKGGGTIVTNSATASVIGTTILVTTTNNGGFKMSVLEGVGGVHFPDGKSSELRPGQMTFVMPKAGEGAESGLEGEEGGDSEQGPVLNFDLATLVGESALVNGFSAPLVSMDKISLAAGAQAAQIAQGDLVETGLAIIGALDAQNFAVADAVAVRQQSVAADMALTIAQDEEMRAHSNVHSDNTVHLGDGETPGPGFLFEEAVNNPLAGLDETVVGVIAGNVVLGDGTFDLGRFDGGTTIGVVGDHLEFAGDTVLSGLADADKLVLAGNTVSNLDGASVEVVFGSGGQLVISSGTAWTADSLTVTNQSGGVELVVQSGDLQLRQSEVNASSGGGVSMFDGDVRLLAEAGSLSVLQCALNGAGLVELAAGPEGNVLLQDSTVTAGSGISLYGTEVRVDNGTLNVLGGIISVEAEALAGLSGMALVADRLIVSGSTVTVERVTFSEGMEVTLFSRDGLLVTSETAGAVFLGVDVKYSNIQLDGNWDDLLYVPGQNIGNIGNPIHVLEQGAEELRMTQFAYASAHELEHVTVGGVEEISNNFVFRNVEVLPVKTLDGWDTWVTDADLGLFAGLWAKNLTVNNALLSVILGEVNAGKFDFSGMSAPRVKFYSDHLTVGDLLVAVPSVVRGVELGALETITVAVGANWNVDFASSDSGNVFLVRSQGEVTLDNLTVDVFHGSLEIASGSDIAVSGGNWVAGCGDPSHAIGHLSLNAAGTLSLQGATLQSKQNAAQIHLRGDTVTLANTVISAPKPTGATSLIEIQGMTAVALTGGRLTASAVRIGDWTTSSGSSNLVNLSVDGTEFASPAVAMDARTIVVRNVNFAEGTTVTLRSDNGGLNIISGGGSSMYGAVNFQEGTVQYNGTDVTNAAGIGQYVWVEGHGVGGGSNIFSDGTAQGGINCANENDAKIIITGRN